MYKEERGAECCGRGQEKSGMKTAADEIKDMALSIGGEIQKLTDIFYNKFEKVMLCGAPKEIGTSKPTREYPPYFNELRNSLMEIRMYVDRILDGVNRSEL